MAEIWRSDDGLARQSLVRCGWDRNDRHRETQGFHLQCDADGPPPPSYSAVGSGEPATPGTPRTLPDSTLGSGKPRRRHCAHELAATLLMFQVSEKPHS